jgi:tRNA (cytidine/uridine-2'-O-)-methyltransferase
MIRIALLEPEIPPNTGAIIRLAANTGMPLHLIEPLGFELDDKRLRRAGLDYREYADVSVHGSLAAFKEDVGAHRLVAVSTRGTVAYSDYEYQDRDVLLFGPETRGLPQQMLDSLPADQCVRIPMRPNSRSLNLANAVAIIAYETWRQQGFSGEARAIPGVKNARG